MGSSSQRDPQLYVLTQCIRKWIAYGIHWINTQREVSPEEGVAMVQLPRRAAPSGDDYKDWDEEEEPTDGGGVDPVQVQACILVPTCHGSIQLESNVVCLPSVLASRINAALGI